jgi:hypothetical protein
MALYGAETCMLRAVDQKHVESFEKVLNPSQVKVDQKFGNKTNVFIYSAF